MTTPPATQHSMHEQKIIYDREQEKQDYIREDHLRLWLYSYKEFQIIVQGHIRWYTQKTRLALVSPRKAREKRKEQNQVRPHPVFRAE